MRPEGPVFDRRWREVSTLKLSTRSDPEAAEMIRQHYLGKWPGVCTAVLVMRVGADAAGVIVFALPPRETSKRYGAPTWELARLWIADWVPRNAETWLIGQGVKWVKRNRPDVRMLVSYADPSVGHSGTIYRAANWQSDGCTDQERKTPRFDYADARTGKRYSRRKHVPAEAEIIRIPRVSKPRFVYRLAVNEEQREA